MSRTKSTLIDPDVALLQALGHPTRMAILRQLADCAEVCACDFAMCCDVSQPTISHHLRILREAGVVEAERRGTWIFYRLLPAAAERLRTLATEIGGTSRLIPVSALRAPTPSEPAPTAN
jgi:ArsR family transcriptional regulator